MKVNYQRRRNLLTVFESQMRFPTKVETYQRTLVSIALIVILLCLRSARQISVSSHDLSNRASNDALIYQLVSPETAAARLQDPSWIDTLVYNARKPLLRKKRRIVEWTVKNPPSNGVELFLMPHQFRSTHLIDLFLDGRVEATMGENIAMMGWAKAVLALGCKKVVMFESYVDFVAHLDRSAFQFYMLDYISLPELKDDLLLDPVLRQRTWEFAWWGRSQETLENLLHIPQRYGFQLDHALLPFNYTGNDISKDNMRMAIIPTSITFNHQTRQNDIQLCDVFYMGKSVEDIEKLIPVIKLVEDKLSNDKYAAKDLRLCTAFQIQAESSYEKVLGFKPKYTVNMGRMKPPVFAHIVGNAKVVVGSGW